MKKKIPLVAPYSARRIRHLELWEPPGWCLKVYGIAHQTQPLPDANLLEAVKATVSIALPSVLPENSYGLGFVIVHVCQEATFLLVDYWMDENIIHQDLQWSQPSTPIRFRDLSSSGIMACIWEMRVQAFERQAWVDTVLANGKGPDVDAYLERRLNEDI